MTMSCVLVIGEMDWRVLVGGFRLRVFLMDE